MGQHLAVHLGHGCCTPFAPPDFGGCTPFCTPFAPPTNRCCTPGFGGAPPLHPPAPSKMLDFGILPMYLSFQVHLWSGVLWMLEEYYEYVFVDRGKYVFKMKCRSNAIVLMKPG